MNKTTHILYTPFTGLGLYGGHRGNRWLKNRIKIFKQFVVPSLESQTDKDFILWISWRYEDKGDKNIIELENYLKSKGFKVVFTYSGVCFWDDKYDDETARKRLIESIHGSMGEIINAIGECKNVLMTIQPSDDCYRSTAVEEIKKQLSDKKLQVFGYKKGYVMDYVNRRLCEWNPKTTPPFYTIKFPRDVFIDPLKHIEYTGPYKSHEYVKDYLKAIYIEDRGFLVGTHGENISTIFKHPYAGHEFLGSNIDNILVDFGLKDVSSLKIKISLRKLFMRKLPHWWHKKIRYWFGERFYQHIYNWLRS